VILKLKHHFDYTTKWSTVLLNLQNISIYYSSFSHLKRDNHNISLHAGLEEQSSLSRQSIYPSLSLSIPSSQISLHAGLEEQSSLSRQSIYPSLSLSIPSSQISLEITGEGNGAGSGNGSGLCVGAGMGVGTRLGSGRNAPY